MEHVAHQLSRVWIVGGIADIRHTIAGLLHGDRVGAGPSILEVVPYVGDAVAIPGKAARFVVRDVHRLNEYHHAT